MGSAPVPAVSTEHPEAVRANAASSPAAALDLFSELLAELDGAFSPDAFYGRMCEAICRLTGMERGIICVHDLDRRRVRAVGAHGVDLGLFDGVHISLATAPVAARALAEDRVIELIGDPQAVGERFVDLVAGRRLTCVPMAANGRWVGVVLTDRPATEPPLGEQEREGLWILGKTAALATVARLATAQAERARELQGRLDMAREIHDGVIQRLFGISLALEGDEPLDEGDRRRCAQELGHTLGELRAALNRPLSRRARPTQTTTGEEIDRLAAEHPSLGITLERGACAVPARLEALTQSVLREAVRNAGKHARPRRVLVSLRDDGETFVMQVVNDGVRSPGSGTGMGLRLAAFEALQQGGVLEFGARGGDAWRIRLLVPREPAG